MVSHQHFWNRGGLTPTEYCLGEEEKHLSVAAVHNMTNSRFFAKFAAMRAQKLHSDRSSAGQKGQKHLNKDPEAALADARHALVLFCEFQRRKQAQLREKIEKDRASLPIKALEGQIINTLATNRVVLIAADTGAGKSTQ
ncbi:hypothetical protein HDU89_008909 [Geranomyces variabilis]|nr:hypothetical protein HDU89_008909 [Geranomyces variabilis]